MQQLTRYRPQYTTTLPEAIIVTRDPASFLPLHIYVPAIAGTSTHAALCAVYKVVQDQNIASMILQYTEDASSQLIKRGVVPKLRAVCFMNGRAMTAWSTQNHGPGRVGVNYIYISAPFNSIYMMLDSINDWMLMCEEAGGTYPEIETTKLGIEKLKRFVLAGETRLWLIHTNYICIETSQGFRKFWILFNNFWIWYNDFLDLNSEYTYHAEFDN